jgi:hypothetical protein
MIFNIISIICILYTTADIALSIYMYRTNPVVRARANFAINNIKRLILNR